MRDFARLFRVRGAQVLFYVGERNESGNHPLHRLVINNQTKLDYCNEFATPEAAYAALEAVTESDAETVMNLAVRMIGVKPH